ncbi:hypothetical protein HYV81_05170 [Candidatus Woesearchaeota archaeon]|nr:hypothetical protein [Candidatus Woesearchaeota archaeon]
MYEIFTANNKTEKILKHYLKERDGLISKLQRLKQSPRTEIGAHHCMED